MAKYGAADYWNDRYSNDSEPFDWYQTYATLKPKLSMVVKRSDYILMLGCGSSSKLTILACAYGIFLLLSEAATEAITAM